MSIKKTQGNLTKRILIATALGILFGVLLRSAGEAFWLPDSVLQFVSSALSAGGKLFVSSLRLLVTPLVLVSITCGVASLKDLSILGRLGGKTMGLFLLTTASAITLALVVSANITRPGVGVSISSLGVSSDSGLNLNFGGGQPSFWTLISGLIPVNPFKALADGEMLQIIVLGILLGIAGIKAGPAGERTIKILSDINEVLLQLVMFLVSLAPYGVFCMLASTFRDMGVAGIWPLAKYFFTVLFVLLLHVVLVYLPLLKWVAGWGVKRFIKAYQEVWAVAFSTSSSNATLAVNMEVTEKNLGVPRQISSFVIPLGATINMDGTAIMQGVATVFLSQLYNIPLGFTDYLLVIFTATLASIGTAGVPSVGLVMLAMVLEQVGLPVEGIALILGVDRLLDMSRTVVNVTGDAIVSMVVARSEKVPGTVS